MILEKFDKMIIGEVHMVTGKTRNIFKNKPGFWWDNYFSGDNFFDHAGKRIYGMLLTVRRDHIPKGFPAQYMQNM